MKAQDHGKDFGTENVESGLMIYYDQVEIHRRIRKKRPHYSIIRVDGDRFSRNK